MKCPECGAWSIIKETKRSPTFGYKRRRECANEHRFTTQEIVIPQEALNEERRAHGKANYKRLESIRASGRKSSRKTA
jgi:transcriptional regulator NrdR family protein